LDRFCASRVLVVCVHGGSRHLSARLSVPWLQSDGQRQLEHAAALSQRPQRASAGHRRVLKLGNLAPISAITGGVLTFVDVSYDGLVRFLGENFIDAGRCFSTGYEPRPALNGLYSLSCAIFCGLLPPQHPTRFLVVHPRIDRSQRPVVTLAPAFGLHA